MEHRLLVQPALPLKSSATLGKSVYQSGARDLTWNLGVIGSPVCKI